jgi:hypothetical protein
MSVVFEAKLTPRNRWIEARCDPSDVTGKMTSCFHGFKCHGKLHSIPDSVQQKFLEWQPVDPDAQSLKVEPDG